MSRERERGRARRSVMRGGRGSAAEERMGKKEEGRGGGEERREPR